MATIRLSCLVLLACAAASACGRHPSAAAASVGAAVARADGGYPLSIRDDRGTTITISKQPERIVALLPSYTEALFALGVGNRVVGVDDFSEYPPEVARLPRLGGLYDTHLEGVLSLRPDLVLVSDPNGAAAALEQNGLVVWAGDSPRFDDVFRVLEAIGKMVGRTAEATQLSERIRAEVATVEDRLSGFPRVRVYYEIDATPYTVGPSSFIGAMLSKAGGENIIPANLGDFPKINPEAVIAGNPEVIVGASLEDVAARPGWRAISAVRTGRVYKLPMAESRVVVCPGPRIAEGLRALARRLHPEVQP